MGFEHWEVRFGKNMDWEMEFVSPFRTLYNVVTVK